MAVFATIPEGVFVCVILLDLCIGMYVVSLLKMLLNVHIFVLFSLIQSSQRDTKPFLVHEE